jgi:hypothetical protein
VVQIIFSQLPNFHELWWLSVIAAVMSFSYATIAVGLALGQAISGTVYACNCLINNTNNTTHSLAGNGQWLWQVPRGRRRCMARRLEWTLIASRRRYG